MTRPAYIERGDTIYWGFNEATGNWSPCNHNPDQHLAAGMTVMETYVVQKFEPKEPPPRKVPKYKPVYKPRAVKRKPIMPIALPHTL